MSARQAGVPAPQRCGSVNNRSVTVAAPIGSCAVDLIKGWVCCGRLASALLDSRASKVCARIIGGAGYSVEWKRDRFVRSGGRRRAAQRCRSFRELPRKCESAQGLAEVLDHAVKRRRRGGSKIGRLGPCESRGSWFYFRRHGRRNRLGTRRQRPSRCCKLRRNRGRKTAFPATTNCCRRWRFAPRASTASR